MTTSLSNQTENKAPAIPMWQLAWQLFKRDIRQGEPRIMALALILTTTAVAAVGFFNQRVETAMQSQGAALIAGDLLVKNRKPLPTDIIEIAKANQLQTAQYAQFPTVAFNQDDDTLLITLKAVEPGYPLRGDFITGESFENQEVANSTPAPGEAWIAPTVRQKLGVDIGDSLYIGELTLSISKIIQQEPDRPAGFMSLSPRVLIAWEDLAPSELLGPGSRASYALTLAGAPNSLATYQAEIQTIAEAHNVDVQNAAQARPELRAAFERLSLFLTLSSLVTVMVAGAAIAMAAHGFVRRQSDAVAIFRCFGASSATIWHVVWRRLFLLTTAATAIGALGGFVIQHFAVDAVANMMKVDLPPPSLTPLIAATLTTVITILGFSLPAFIQLKQIPVLRVLRRDLGTTSTASRWSVFAAILAMSALVLWRAGEIKLGATVLLALIATPLLLALLTYAVIHAFNKISNPLRPGIIFGLTLFARRGRLSMIQTSSLGLGVLAIYLLSVVSVELLSSWQQEIPDDAPNYFLINIQPDQAALATQKFDSLTAKPPALEPVVRGRWVKHNDQEINVEDYPDDERRQSLLRRDFNLTYAENPRTDTDIIEGQWWDTNAAHSVNLISIEEGISQRFNIKMGDTMTFRIAGQDVTSKVTSIRKVEWQSFNTNYFVIGTPHAFSEVPHTYIGAVNIPKENNTALGAVLKSLPGVSILDVDAILSRVKGIIQQSIRVIYYVFTFSIIASVLVLIASVYSTRGLRGREIALLRVIGGQSRVVLISVLTEFALIGFVASFIAAGVASFTGWILASTLFDLSYQPNVLAVISLSLLGALLTTIVGWLSVRNMLAAPPQRVLMKEA